MVFDIFCFYKEFRNSALFVFVKGEFGAPWAGLDDHAIVDNDMESINFPNR